jgi:hypothetical protein
MRIGLSPWKSDNEKLPFQATAGNWVFFWIYVLRTPRVVGTQTVLAMTTIGLDGVE